MSRSVRVDQPIAGHAERFRHDVTHRVLVVGGGLAGCSAALTLARHGAQVTIAEACPMLGGRLSSWPETLSDGSTVSMERGFHAFFRQYHNTRNLLRELDPSLRMLRKVDDYPLVGPNGLSESFAGLPPIPILNVAALTLRSPSLKLRELRRMNTNTVQELFAYDPVRTHAELDHMSAGKYLDDINFPADARRVIFDVFARSFFNDPADMSAAELIKMFHVYFMGSWESICFDVLDEPFDVAVWQPMTRVLEQLGTTIAVDTKVASLTRDGATWTGEGVDGTYDSVVLALPVPALRKVVAASPTLVSSEWRDNVSALPSAPPFSVLRLWLDRRVHTSRPPFLGTSGIGLCDNISVVDAYQGEARRWSYQHDASVIELHAYALPEGRHDPADVRGDLLATLHQVYPETVDAVIVDERHLLRHDCPGFPPGMYERRPTVHTSDPTVVVAGDYVRLPFPAALMEAAVSSGRVAANTLLAEQRVAGDAVYSIPLRGVGASALSWWRKTSKRGAPGTSPERMA